jgi:glycosyltransferase involved in cell wall biosynthesis
MTKILLVSETLPHPDRGGSSLTLYNIFKDYGLDNFYCYTFSTSARNALVEPFVNNVLIADKKILFRVGSWFPFSGRTNLILSQIDEFLVRLLPLQHLKVVKKFNPDVVLFCPLTAKLLKEYPRFKSKIKCPSIVYFMDDWPVGGEHIWDAKIKQMLNDASGHFFISEYLEQSMQERLGFNKKKFLAVHNPIDLHSIVYSNIEIETTGTFRIVYAGSLWGIQLDAVKQLAEAVGFLRKIGVDIVLELYTQDRFYEPLKNFWDENGIVFGGWIPSAELRKKLHKMDLLLVASSFLEEYKNLTLGSLQTKVTDYLAACRPVLCLGPSYSANNLFVKKWDCGLTFESSSVNELADFISELIPRRNSFRDKIQNGVKVLEQKLNTKVVFSEVQDFIKNIALVN